MTPVPQRFRGWPSKLLAALAILLLAVIGLIGIVLPVIPGLLFLALAVLLAARHVPWIDVRLRRHRAFGPHMHRFDRFLRLGLIDQLRVGLLYTVKGTLHVLDRISTRLMRSAP